MNAPPSKWQGTDETLELPGALHVLRAHRYDAGQVTIEAWSPYGGPVSCYMSVSDRKALAAFLLKDLADG